MATSAARATPLTGADEQLELAPRSFDDIHRAALSNISVRVGPAATEAEVRLAQNARGGIPCVVYDCSLVMAHLLRTSPAWAGDVRSETPSLAVPFSITRSTVAAKADRGAAKPRPPSVMSVGAAPRENASAR